MKHLTARTATVISLIGLLSVGVPTVAYASSTTSTVASHTSTTVVTPWTTWRATWVSYAKGIKSINETFHTSIGAARAQYRSSLASATTKSERQADLATLEASIVLAINTRVSAINAAGSPPSPPAGYNGTAWVMAFQAANETYRQSVASAQATYATAINSATTALERSAARGALETSVGTALTVRANTLETLGAPPVHPGQLS